jgi:hypothetical protein
LWERYLERKWQIENDLKKFNKKSEEFKRLFHGTTAAESIIRNGFDVSYSDLQGMLGKGSKTLAF